MKYHGPLYGKIGRKFIKLIATSNSVDETELKLEQCRVALVLIASDETSPEQIYNIAETTLIETAPKP